jgi:hypothetical protein
MVQGLSFLSLFLNPEISGSNLNLQSDILFILVVGAIFYTTGAAAAALMMRFSGTASIFSVQCHVSPEIFNRRALLMILTADTFLIVLVWLFGSLRFEVFIGVVAFLGIPLSVIITKLPLLYAFTRPRLAGRELVFLVAHYVFISLVYESKMGLIYLVLIATLFLGIRGIVIFAICVASGVGLMIIWAAVSVDNFESVDRWGLVFLALDSFLNRFDSIRVALLVLGKNHNSLAVNDVLEAFGTLLPSCSATKGCLNLTAEISEKIIGTDVSVGVYEINIVSEATVLFGELSVPIYTFLVGFIAQYIAGAFSLKFRPKQSHIPVSAICFMLLPTSLWSAALISTRVIPFFIIELICLAIIVRLLARAKF